MTSEFALLMLTSISVAFIHTLTGPDHYLPFIAMSKARNWSLAKTAWFTMLCGVGHVGSSILVGAVGIALGLALPKLVFFESVRGSLTAWLLTAFGLVYLVWGLTRLLRNRPHRHRHMHADGLVHEHAHQHQAGHLHVHAEAGNASLTPWILFTIFIFGPCEPLIPIVMFPALKHHVFELLAVTGAFSLVTILTMLSVVLTTAYGVQFLPMKVMEKGGHALAGGAVFVCGLGMVLLGL